jgi:hypothetical protein
LNCRSEKEKGVKCQPKALNLAEAYNTLSIEQLKEEEEFEEFYVDRPTSSPIEALKDEIELSNKGRS